MNSKIESAVNWALSVAADDRHGYDQTFRWGPDYDCATFVISAFQQAGIPVKSAGASYTGNMRGAFLRSGFVDVTDQIDRSTGAGLKRGDVLLTPGTHAAIAVNGMSLVHSSVNELGTGSGGESGDQTGREIFVREYYDRPWVYVLRYVE